MTVNIDSKLLAELQQSTCFGLAHDATVPECKQCDVQAQCKAKSEGGNIPTPTTRVEKPVVKKEDKPVETKKKSKASGTGVTSKPDKPKAQPKKANVPSGNLPDFKPMSLEDLKELAKERNVEWKEYGNDNITRMRLIMALKPTYQ